MCSLQLLKRKILRLRRPYFPNCTSDKRRTAREEVPKSDSKSIDIGAGVDLPLTSFIKLFGTRERRCTDESSLRLSSRIRRHYFGHAVVDYFDQDFTARGRLDHQIGRLDVTMHHAANFRCGQSARCLLNDFKRERQGQWSVTLNTGFERFAFDKFHCVKTFTVLLTVMRHACNVRMMNFCGCARFAQKARARDWIFCQLPANHLERHR